MILELAAASGLLYGVWVLASHYAGLPERVPTHFGLAGEPDGYGSKSISWVVILIGALLYAGLTVMNRFPHTFNYLFAITEVNYERQYRMARRFVRILKAEMTWTFGWIERGIVGLPAGDSPGLGPVFLPAVLVVIFGSVGFYIWLALRAK